jgi:hypothetical protein
MNTTFKAVLGILIGIGILVAILATQGGGARSGVMIRKGQGVDPITAVELA